MDQDDFMEMNQNEFSSGSWKPRLKFIVGAAYTVTAQPSKYGFYR